MAQSRDDSPSRIELVVLACLSQSKPTTEVEIGEAIHQLGLANESADASRRRAAELLTGLVRRGFATADSDGARGKSLTALSPGKLTDSGKRALREAFQLKKVPSWSQVRDKHLPAMALGLPPGSEMTKKACTESGLVATIVGARLGVRDALTPTAVCDALIADALGMPRGKLTMDAMRAHVLSRAIDKQAKDPPGPEVRGYAGRLATWIAASAVGATGDQRKMARALSRRWVSGEAPLHGSPVPGHTTAQSSPPVVAPNDTGLERQVSNSTQAPLDKVEQPPMNNQQISPPAVLPSAAPQNLLEVVRETIPRIGADGRFGEKVYVSAIWRTIERDRKGGALSLENFKSWLLTANRDGKLVLARADLMGAMDAKQINESEIKDRGTTFHFVLDQRNGSVVSQRESHAR